jgi:hypothetical protein
MLPKKNAKTTKETENATKRMQKTTKETENATKRMQKTTKERMGLPTIFHWVHPSFPMRTGTGMPRHRFSQFTHTQIDARATQSTPKHPLAPARTPRHSTRIPNPSTHHGRRPVLPPATQRF